MTTSWSAELFLDVKICKKCSAEKAEDDFNASVRHSDGRYPWCKPCQKAYDQARYRKDPAAWKRQLPPDKIKRNNLKRLYGISLEFYQGMLEQQGGCCAACRRPFEGLRPNVDHDHRTGVIRGLLCHNCNVALGLVRDEVKTLRNLISYLETPSMLLSARILYPFADVNDFDFAQVFQMTEGEQQVVTFQLIDAAKNPPTQYFYPFGLRYCPASGATLQCQLASIDDAQTVTRYASQPYPTRAPSIWQLTLLSTDKLAGTFALKLSLNEGGVTKKGVLQQAVQIASTTASFC